jgi:hypothetical protein
MTTMHAEPMLMDSTATPARAARLTTGLLAIVMAASGIAFLIGPPGVVEALRALGYPSYVRLVLGAAKLLGAGALLGSRPMLREWAYAGFTFLLLGAIASHLLGGRPADAVPAAVLLGLLGVSYRLGRVAS